MLVPKMGLVYDWDHYSYIATDCMCFVQRYKKSRWQLGPEVVLADLCKENSLDSARL